MVEAIIDTSKLQFKKKSITPNAMTVSQKGSKARPLTSSNAKMALTKSHSQNESVTVPQRNLVNINPAATSSNSVNSSGGIANMSFDDY